MNLPAPDQIEPWNQTEVALYYRRRQKQIQTALPKHLCFRDDMLVTAAEADKLDFDMANEWLESFDNVVRVSNKIKLKQPNKKWE